MTYEPRALRRKRRPKFGLAAILVVITLIVAWFILPSFLNIEKAPDGRSYLVYQGERHPFPVVIENDEAYVPLTFIKSVLDPNVFFDDQGIVVVTTEDKVVKLKTDSLTGYVNQNPVELRFPVVLDAGEPYIPASILSTLYPVSAYLNEEDNLFLVQRLDLETLWAETSRDVIVRVEPSFVSRRVGVLARGTEVRVFETKRGWSKVETPQGYAGYLPDNSLGTSEKKLPQVEPVEGYSPSPLAGEKVSLVWEQVDVRTPDPSTIDSMPGVNVVSPTWFSLADENGNLDNRADLRYVQWAHSEGYQVWALFSNSFDPVRTSEVLRNSDLRDKVISQLLIYSKIYSLDGINIDFENVYQEDAPYLTQFVRELAPLLHQANLTVSIDVTVKSQSPNWSLCYERSRLAEAVDYVMLMAYDQFPANSKVAGPTSAIPWTEWTIKTTLQEVPEDKLVLGIPFYTRLWTETKEGQLIDISQKAYTMNGAENWVVSEGVTPIFDQEHGLNYVEKTVGKDTYKMWIEDSDSLRKRIELAVQYDLAGIAAWRRGYEKPEVWNVIEDYVGQP